MNEQAKEARRAYKRKWQRENREKVKQYQETYWNKKAQGGIEGSPDEQRDEPREE